MEQAIQSLIAGAAGVSALASARVYAGDAPQGTPRPFVRINTVAGVRDYHMAGASGFVASRVQVDCFGATYPAAKNLATAVAAAVTGYSGTIGGIELQGVFIDNEIDDSEDDTGRASTIYRVLLELSISWKPTA